MKKKIWILPVVAVALGAAVYAVMQKQQSEDERAGYLFASGNLEATEVQLSFRQTGILDRRPIEEGEKVAQGALIAALDRREMDARITEAEAALEAARSEWSELRNGYREEEIAVAAARAREAEANLRELQRSARRAERLYQGGALSREARDRERTAAQMARASHEAAVEELRRLRRGQRPERIAAAAARVKQREAAVAALQAIRNDMTVHSPISGRILRTHAEAGETLTAGRPVATIADLERPWVRVYIPETRIGEVTAGSATEVRIDTWPDRRFEGRVSYIADEAEFTPKNVQTQEERVKLVFAVDIDVENPEGVLKPGMPADVWIRSAEQP